MTNQDKQIQGTQRSYITTADLFPVPSVEIKMSANIFVTQYFI